jgi:hypothetical protein
MIIEEGSLLFEIFQGLQNLWDFKKSHIEIPPYSFDISPAARRTIRWRAASVGADTPIKGLTPTLMRVRSYKMSDQEGNVFAQYSGDLLDIQYSEPAQVSGSEFFKLDHLSISIDRAIVAHLDGKTLVMRYVKDGYPEPYSRQCRVMMAE